MTINSAIVNNGANAVGLTKSGTGALVIGGSNTFTGQLTINNGALQLGGSSALSSTPAAFFGNSGTSAGTLNLNGFNATLASLNDSPGDATIMVTANALAITSTAAATLTIGGSVPGSNVNSTYDGKISGAISLVNGGGTLTLRGGNLNAQGMTYTGSTTVNAGTILLAGANADAFSSNQLVLNVNQGMSFAAGVVGTMSVGALSGSGNESLVQTNGVTPVTLTLNNATAGFTSTYSGVLSGAGGLTVNGNAGFTQILSGANTYSGPTTLTAGILIMAGSNSSAGGSTLSGGTLQLDNASDGGLAGGLLTLGGGALQSLLTSLALSNTVSLTATSTVLGSQAITLNGPFGQTTSATLTNNLASGGTLTMAGNVNIDAVTGSALTLTLAGSGNTLISGAIQDYSGGVGSSHGALTVSNSGTTTLSGASSYQGATSFTGAGTLNLTGTLNGTSITVNNAAAIFNESNAGMIAGAANTFALSAGSATLAGANSYGGGTTISGGTLVAGSSTALGSPNAALTMNGASAIFDLHANNVGVGGLIGTSATAEIVNNASGSLATLSVGNGIATATYGATYAGVIADHSVGSGTLGLLKVGIGSQTLSGANTYSGGTTINAGTLALNGASGSLNASGPLAFAGPGTFNYASGPAGTSGTLGAVTFSSGDGIIQSTYGISGTTTLNFASVARTSGATGNFVLIGGTAGTPGNPGTPGNNNIVLSLTSTGFIDPGIFYGGAATTATYAYYDAGGFVRGINYGVDANSLSVTASGATIGAVNSSAPYNNVEVGNFNITGQTTATVSTLQLTGSANFTLAAGATFAVNSILKAGNTSGGTLSGGSGIQPATLNGDLVVRTDMAADTLTINTPVILANGTNALVKSGAGTLTFSGTNNLSGGLYLNGGTFTVSASSASAPPARRSPSTAARSVSRRLGWRSTPPVPPDPSR